MKNLVVAVDHGFGYIKTVSNEFKAGLKEFENEPPTLNSVVKYENKYYALGGKRQSVKPEKWIDENYWIMTLGAIAEELGGVRQANVYLAVGLPLTRYGADKEKFKSYLHREGNIHFEYEKQSYDIQIKDVRIYPQGYCTVVDRLKDLSDMVLVCDVGSWTVDILPLENGVPNLSHIDSLNEGVIRAMNDINEELRRTQGSEVDETIIQNIMRGKEVKLSFKYKDIINHELKNYAKNVLSQIRERGYNLDTTEVIFTGGGATVIKKFGEYDNYMTSFIEDIHANAKGYQMLAEAEFAALSLES